MIQPGALLLLALPALASAQEFTITHQGVGCVVAEQFPGLEARFDPADSVAEAHVLFRPAGGAHWYSVRMKRERAGFTALLPKPKKSLKGFAYYVEATDRALATARTEEFNAIVADGLAGCRGKIVARAWGTGQVALQAVSGAPKIPLGFSSSGVATTTTAAAAGAAATGAAGATAAVTGGAAAAGGGGFSTGLLVAGGVVAAGGVAAAVVVAGAKDDRSSGGGGGPPPPGAEVRGQVFAFFTPRPVGTGPGIYSDPVAGARVSSSLDSVTTTTGGDGRFHLVTQTPGRCFTLTITASGFPTYSFTQDWNNGSSGAEMIISLVPPQPNPSGGGPCTPF